MALFRTLPTPTNDLLPSLMVEVCLVPEVLAPDVNFLLNSHKQGLPCWRSISFFLSTQFNVGRNKYFTCRSIAFRESTSKLANRLQKLTLVLIGVIS